MPDQLTKRIVTALDQAVSALVSRQQPDGSFQDFYLPPGASNGWITGFTSVAIDDACSLIAISGARVAIQNAASFLLRRQRESGWGYNDLTATDADSSAFAIRAIKRAEPAYQFPGAMLELYLDESGHAHTFLDQQKMGAWAGRHADVTASVGLALHEIKAPSHLQELLIKAVLKSINRQGIWDGYWWHLPYYSTWLNLFYLNRVQRLEPLLAKTIRRQLCQLTGDLSVMDVAAFFGCLLEVAIVTGESTPVAIIEHLLQLQQKDGRWPTSACLILPEQWAKAVPDISLDEQRRELVCYGDIHGILTTSIVIQILIRWLSVYKSSFAARSGNSTSPR